MFRKWSLVIPLATALVACGPITAPTPTVQPTTAPTTVVVEPTSGRATAVPPTTEPTVAAPTVAPTTAPTSAPAPVGVLPAPLYLLENGQIARLEVDGQTRTPITDEEPVAAEMLAIIEFAASPVDSSLAYVLQGIDGGNTLIVTDAEGQNRRVLLQNVPLSAPRWSPDGSALAVQMFPPFASGSPWQAGVYVVSVFSGEARLIIANDPVPADGASMAWGYAPEAWSPDGSKLLVNRFSLVAETCEAAVVAIDSGTLTTFQAPEDETPPLRVQCTSGAWDADSSGYYTVLRAPGLSPPVPGLYRADATTGMVNWVIPETDAQSRFHIVQSQSVGVDGKLYVLMAVTDTIPDITVNPNLVPPRVKPYRVEDDGTYTALSDEDYILYGTPLWASNSSGVLIPAQIENGNLAYTYVPFQGEPTALPLSPVISMAWGR
jgi:dipeptidyl aminopeptidase/acylaminoacyl peptidase